MRRAASLLLLGLLLGMVGGTVGPHANRSATGPSGTVMSVSDAAGDQQGRTGMGRRVLAVVGAVAAAVALLSLLLLVLEDRFVYQPSAEPAVSFRASHFGARECGFRAEDGTQLHGWWHPGAGSETTGERPVILWCHGNAGNITHRAENMDLLVHRGLATLLFDYRGYGRSEGRPSEDGLYADGEAAWHYLTEQRDVRPERIVCFGRSLGAAVALHVALSHRVAGLIVEGAFESVPAMARNMFPLLPVWRLTRNSFENVGRIGDLRVPLLVVHGGRDRLVPVSQGRAVFSAAPEPKELYVVEGADHNDTYAVGGDAYFERIETFCRECVRRAGR